MIQTIYDALKEEDQEDVLGYALGKLLPSHVITKKPEQKPKTPSSKPPTPNARKEIKVHGKTYFSIAAAVRENKLKMHKVLYEAKKHNISSAEALERIIPPPLKTEVKRQRPETPQIEPVQLTIGGSAFERG